MSGVILKPVFLIFLSFCFISYNIRAQKLTDKGRLSGTVRNQRNEVLVSASVKIRDRQQPGITNLNGEYEADLPPGNYSVIFTYAGYLDQEITNVVIRKGEVTKLNIVLDEKPLNEVVVTASRRRSAGSVASLYNTQKNSVSVMDGISIDLIRKTPDVNVAQSLRRINGVTVLNEKFVIVRGMADRYNNFFLNGAQLPSTESDKKNFSFDLIPNNLIDNIVVSKTASPDLPADFVGGIIQVNTKEIPDKNTFFISAGTGYNFNSTRKGLISTKIYDSEYFGKTEDKLKWFNTKDPATRKIFDFVTNFEPGSPEVVKAAEPLVRADNWRFYRYTAMPMQTYQIGAGLRKRFNNKNSFGAYLAGTYRNQQLTEDYFRGSILSDSIEGKQYEFTTNIAGLASLAYNLGKSKFVSNTIITRTYSHTNNIVSGKNNDLEPVITYGNFLEGATLVQTKFEGEHIVGQRNIRLNWSGDRAEINRDQPDSRFIDYQKVSNLTSDFNSPYPYLPNTYVKNRTSNVGIFSSTLSENRKGLAANVTLPFTMGGKKQSIKAGYLYNKREVEFDLSFLRVVAETVDGPNVLYGLDMDDIFTLENFREGLTNFNTSFSARYYAQSRLNAGYALLDLNITPKFHFVGGARAEDYNWIVQRIKNDSTPGRNDFKIYPSANLIYKLTNKSNIRLSFSETVSRPDFRESASFQFYDYRTNINYGGNPGLINAIVTNYDLRYEIFPGSEELISASIFYKKFKDPIESINAIIPDAGTLFNFSLNQKSSTNIGFELDFRKSLEFIARNSGFLKKLFVGGNGSYMISEVEIDADALRSYYLNLVALQNSANPLEVTGGTRKRPLVGLSPYSMNGAVSYEDEICGITVTYNRIGKRVIFSGLSDSTDIYENPRDVIDFQVSGKFFKKRMEVRLNVSDILNQRFIHYMNNYKLLSPEAPPRGSVDPKGYNFEGYYDKTFYQARRGSSLSLSVSYRW